MPGYRIFKRTWWRENPSWPNGLEPGPGKRHYVRDYYDTEAKCQLVCQRLNTELARTMTAQQRRLGLRYEYERF